MSYILYFKDLLLQFIDIILHLNVYLATLTASWGIWTYVILILVIFCETGLVVTPFLPGDSLLFAAGAIAALPNANLDVSILCVGLSIAAIVGDALNYKIGKQLGKKVFDPHRFRWIKQEHLRKTHEFYERHGGKTIIFARFVPIVRTFAPFVAGVSEMSYKKFATYNIVGGVVWVVSLTCAGYFFGNIPSIQRNFHLVIFGIIGVSFMPVIVELFFNLRRKNAAAQTKRL